MKTAELTDALLDYYVAQCEGYVWARNMAKRSGDSFRRANNLPDQFPVGERFFISPSKAKGMMPDTTNWDGWQSADISDPVAKDWNYELPSFSTEWRHAGPIIERERIDVISGAKGKWSARIADWKTFGAAIYCKDHRGAQVWTDSPLTAAMRTYVASKFGDDVDDVVLT